MFSKKNNSSSSPQAESYAPNHYDKCSECGHGLTWGGMSWRLHKSGDAEPIHRMVKKTVTCTCPDVAPLEVALPSLKNPDGTREVYYGKSWSDICPEHGVGTEYFQKLDSLPYGYYDERYTTREEWIEFKSRD